MPFKLPSLTTVVAASALALFISGCDGGDERARDADPGTTEDAPRLDLDRLYSLPSLIGTTPGLATWSSDGEWIAFAWNDGARPFRDVWVYSPYSEELRRVTTHADERPEDSLHRGISEIAWLGADDAGLAYVLDGDLHLVDLAGMSERIEQGRERIRQVQVSPDGRYLSYVAGGAADGREHTFAEGGALWKVPLENGVPGEAVQLVSAAEPKAFVQSYEWARDTSRIAFVRADNSDMPERDIHYYAQGGELQVDTVTRAFPGDETTRRSLGVVEVDSGNVRWLELANDQYPIWNYGLSADGSRLFANTSNFVVKEHTIYVYDVASGARETFYHFEDPENVIPGWQAEWAPGDDGLIILTDRDGWYHLYHQAEAGGTPRALTSGEWEIASFEVDTDNGHAYFIANLPHPSERHVFRLDLEGGEPVRLTGEAGTWTPTFSPDYSSAALHFSNDTTPPDLYFGRPAEGADSIARITDSPLPEFHEHRWATISYPSFESHVDGATIHARLSVPPDFDPQKRYPLIVGSVYADAMRNQWGGRIAHPTWGIDQYFVANGYLVLNPNMRGSWGHGKVFSSGLLNDYGGIDTDDIESGVRHLIAEGYVDPERVGIWGSSYGGLMTLMSLFKKPGVYAAGIAGAPATNVWHAYPSQKWVMGERRGDDYPDRYRRQSALYHYAGLQDPLMIIHGTQDPVVLYSDTIALVERMIADGKQFELLTLPGGSHSWATDSLEQTRFIFRKMVDFFDRHLK